MAQAAGFTPSGAVAAGKILELRPQAQLRKNDVFDSPNFNPISFINQIYPEESSLQDLDKFIDVLRRQVGSWASEPAMPGRAGLQRGEVAAEVCMRLLKLPRFWVADTWG
jgi:hypothetical protein